jgi:hypothetical protein
MENPDRGGAQGWVAALSTMLSCSVRSWLFIALLAVAERGFRSAAAESVPVPLIWCSKRLVTRFFISTRGFLAARRQAPTRSSLPPLRGSRGHHNDEAHALAAIVEAKLAATVGIIIPSLDRESCPSNSMIPSPVQQCMI